MKNRLILLCMCILLLVSGCWDQVEIEEVGFVMGAALDPVEENMNDDQHDQKFRLTFQIAKPEFLEEAGQAMEGQEGEGPAADEPFINISTTGMTNFKQARFLSSKLSRRVNFEHLQIIIMQEELARHGAVEHLLDFFVRDHEMRRRTPIYISEQEAATFLKQEIPLEDLPPIFIEMTNENFPAVHEMTEPTEIGHIAERFLGRRSYIIPRLQYDEETGIIIDGAAIFDGVTNQLIDFLEREDIHGYNWVRGEMEIPVIEVDQEEGRFIFEVDEAETDTTYRRENDTDIFDVEMRAEGFFAENWIHDVEINDAQTLQRLEEDIAKEIEEEASRIIHKMQNELYLDIFDFIELVRIEEYDYWKEHKKAWDGEEDSPFTQAEIHIHADVQLRHHMLREGLERTD